MDNEVIFKKNKRFYSGLWKRVLLLLAVFGPATITAMADNDAGGIATYSVAGAKLGYPILFILPIITAAVVLFTARARLARSLNQTNPPPSKLVTSPIAMFASTD